MVSEPWIPKMPSAKTKKTKKNHQSSTPASPAAAATVGILSFEVAAAMSRAIHLHRSLSDVEISRLRSQTLASPALRSLVSVDDRRLLALVLAERLDDLNRLAAAAARLGRRCRHPTLAGFEHVYADLLAGEIPDPALALGSLNKESIRRMERLVASTSSLYAELESLAELEQSAKKSSLPLDESRRALDQKIQWQRHDVKILRDASLWNQTYDKVGLLLARAVFSIYTRIRQVFGDVILELDCLIPDESRLLSCSPIEKISPNRHLPTIRSDFDVEFARNFRREGLRLHCGASPGRLFMECLNLSGSSAMKDIDDTEHFENESCLSRSLAPSSGKIGTSKFGPKSKLLMLASASTVGGSALALHYANIVIIIDKLLKYPHLVGEEVRDDLYQMLPVSLRAALRKSLKSFVKNLAIYDAPLAHDWKDKVEKILSWLAPMAHNMIRWQTERNFEQQQIVFRANVLLLETLYFADRQKTESAICELLFGLSYICRYEQQQHALLDCGSSIDFDDCMDWRTQY